MSEYGSKCAELSAGQSNTRKPEKSYWHDGYFKRFIAICTVSANWTHGS